MRVRRYAVRSRRYAVRSRRYAVHPPPQAAHEPDHSIADAVTSLITPGLLAHSCSEAPMARTASRSDVDRDNAQSDYGAFTRFPSESKPYHSSSLRTSHPNRRQTVCGGSWAACHVQSGSLTRPGRNCSSAVRVVEQLASFEGLRWI